MRSSLIKKVQEFKSLQQSLVSLTSHLRLCPYSPSAWLARAKSLLRLQYPELAIGDTYKALSLIEESRKPSSKLTHCVKLEVAKELCMKQNQGHFTGLGYVDQHILFQGKSTTEEGSLSELPVSMATEITQSDLGRSQIQSRLIDLEFDVLLLLAQALLVANSFSECLDIIREHAKKFPDSTEFVRLRKIVRAAQEEEKRHHASDPQTRDLTPAELLELMRYGEVYIRPYPWMTHDMLYRDSSLVGSIKENLEGASRKQCNLKSSNVRSQRSGKTPSHVLASFSDSAGQCELSENGSWGRDSA